MNKVQYKIHFQLMLKERADVPQSQAAVPLKVQFFV